MVKEAGTAAASIMGLGMAPVTGTREALMRKLDAVATASSTWKPLTMTLMPWGVGLWSGGVAADRAARRQLASAMLVFAARAIVTELLRCMSRCEAQEGWGLFVYLWYVCVWKVGRVGW